MPSRRQQLLRGVLVMMLCFGLFTTWALATARYGGPDETGHVLRAAGVGRGDLLGETVPGLVPGFRSFAVPAALTTGDPRCFRHDGRLPATCASADSTATGTRRAGSSAGTTPPWYAAAVGLPVRALGDPAQVVWYRLVAAAWCALVVGLAGTRARRTAPGVLIAVLACISPAVWFLFGVVNPNSLEIALAILAWVSIERLGRRADCAATADLLWVGVPAAAMILVRPVAALPVAAMFVVVLLTERGRSRRLTRGAWMRLVLPVVAAITASLVWSRWTATAISDSRSAIDLSVLRTVQRAVSATADTAREMSGSLGWLEFSAPWPAQMLWWATVAVAGVLAVRARGSLRAAWMTLAVLTVVGPIVFESVLAGRIGFIWQGRYSLSGAVGLVVVGSGSWQVRRRVLLVSAAVVAEVATFWAVLRRYTVGTNGSWLLRDQRWQPALPPFVLIGSNLVVMCAVIAVSAGAFGNLAPHDVER